MAAVCIHNRFYSVQRFVIIFLFLSRTRRNTIKTGQRKILQNRYLSKQKCLVLIGFIKRITINEIRTHTVSERKWRGDENNRDG